MTRPFLVETILRKNTSSPIQHKLHVEHYGNPHGTPIMCVHGGPGAHSCPRKLLSLRLFDMRQHHILFFDQRGCGKSKSFEEWKLNTPMHSVRDMDAIRKHCGWKKMVLFGGSYGAALSLLYIAHHPQHVSKYIIHSVYLFDDVISKPLQCARPQLWKRLQRLTNQTQLPNVAHTVAHAIQTRQHNKRRLVDAWCALEQSALPPSQRNDSTYKDNECIALMESWFASQNFFFPESFSLVDTLKPVIKKIKGHIVHGQRDLICPVDNIHKLLAIIEPNQTHGVLVPNGDHSIQQLPMKHVLQKHTPSFLAT